MSVWDLAPTVLVFSDSEDGFATAAASVAANGGRILAMLPVEAAVDRLDAQLAADLLMVDVELDQGAILDGLFDRIEEEAASGRSPAVVNIAPALVDLATSCLSHGDVVLLVGRDQPSQQAAVAHRLRRLEPQLRDKAAEEEDGERVRTLSADVGRIVRSFAGLPGEDDRLPSSAGHGEGSLLPSMDAMRRPSAAMIRDIIRARRLRDQFFDPVLFADPAWDMLLDLTAARLEGRSVAVSSLCIAAAVPATTALRWIRQLTEAGLFRRVADPVDGRRVFIELTDGAADAMLAYFSTMARGGKGN